MRVLICHSAPELEEVSAFATAMMSARFDLKTELHGFVPGDDVRAILKSGLDRCEVVLVIFSDSLRSTPWVQPEVVFQVYRWLREGKRLYLLRWKPDSWAPALLRPFLLGMLEDPVGQVERIHSGPTFTDLAPIGDEVHVLIGIYLNPPDLRVEHWIDDRLHQSQARDPADLFSLLESIKPILEARGLPDSEPLSAAFCLELGRRMRQLMLPGSSGEGIATLLDGREEVLKISVCFESNQEDLLDLPFEFLMLPGDQYLVTKENLSLVRRNQGSEAEKDAVYEFMLMAVKFQNWVKSRVVYDRQRVGVENLAMGNVDAARKQFEMSLNITQFSAVNEPLLSEIRAHFTLKLGGALVQLDLLQDALSAYDLGRSILEKAYETEPTKVGYQRNISVVLSHQAHVHTLTGNFVEAGRLYEQVEAIRTRLAEGDSSPQRVIDLANLLLDKGNLLVAMGEAEAAWEAYKQGISLMSEMPNSESLKGHVHIIGEYLLSMWRRHHGKLTHEVGSPPRVRSMLDFFEYLNLLLIQKVPRGFQQQALMLLDNLTKITESQQGSIYQHFRIVAEWHRGEQYLTGGQDGEALKALERALALAEEIAVRLPYFMPLQRDLLHSLLRLGDLHRRMGHGELFRDFLARARGLFEQLRESAPAHWDLDQELALIQQREGQCYLSLGRGVEALDLLQRSLELFQMRAGARPKDLLRKRDLALGYIQLGDAYAFLNDAEKARAIYTKAADLIMQSLEVDPGRLAFHRDYVLVLIRNAGVSPESQPFLEIAVKLLLLLAGELPSGDQALLDLLTTWQTTKS